MTLDDIKARCEDCGDCWHWSGYGGQNGRHPQVKTRDGKVLLVRRLAWAAMKGEIKAGISIVPTCGDVRCINPEHQKAMTESQKGKFYGAQGAFSSPARSRKIAMHRRLVRSKLTQEKADEIRASDESGPVLAERYGVNRSLINSIKRGEAWKDYSSPFAGLLRTP